MKVTVLAWNSRRVLAVQCLERDLEIELDRLKAALRHRYADPRWQVVGGQIAFLPGLRGKALIEARAKGEGGRA